MRPRPIIILILIVLLGVLIYHNKDMFTIAPPRDPIAAEKALRAGERFFGEGHLDQAIEQFDQASQLDPESPLPHAWLGLVYSSRGQPRQALAHWRQATEKAPEVVGYQKNLITTYAELDSLQKALDLLEEILQQNPGNPDLLALKNQLKTASEPEWVRLEPVSAEE